MIPVILSGGSGSRLWPLSRQLCPKQFLALTDPQLSMMQQTVSRVRHLNGMAAPIVVCNEQHRFMAGEQLQQLGIDDAAILLEPSARNTAPAIALAALYALRSDADAILLVMPADHVIGDETAFAGAVAAAESLAVSGALVTFGVVPQHPETGFGYIEAGATQGDGYRVDRFVEKPDLETAQSYLEQGNYYWNAGIFMFRADAYLAELKKHAPEVLTAATKALAAASDDLDFLRVDSAAFAESPSISIDYAVMEKTDQAAIVPLDADWNDVGSWSALWDVSDKDGQGNVVSGDVIAHDSSNSYLYTDGPLLGVVGVEDLVVVVTDDAVMISDRTRSQDVRAVVGELNHLQRSHSQHHRKVYRPWGWYDSLDVGERFQVKRLNLKPGARISLQMHHHRAEHWVVVRGVAEVRKGDATLLLQENESTFIPIGETHGLHNPSETEALEIVEVQSGTYLGEDDIVRFEDVYGRSTEPKHRD